MPEQNNEIIMGRARQSSNALERDRIIKEISQYCNCGDRLENCYCIGCDTTIKISYEQIADWHIAERNSAVLKARNEERGLCKGCSDVIKARKETAEEVIKFITESLNITLLEAGLHQSEYCDGKVLAYNVVTEKLDKIISSCNEKLGKK